MSSPRPGACVHCLRHVDAPTWDHGIPLAFYPAGPTGEKMKAPSCAGCQASLRLAEERLLHALGVCLGPRSPTTAAVSARVSRAIDRTKGRSPDDSVRRERARHRLARTAFLPDSDQGAFPGFGREDGGSPIAVTIAGADVQTFGEKVARAAVWHLRSGAFIRATHEVCTHVVWPAASVDVEEIIRRFGTHYHPCVGVRVVVLTAADEPGTHMILTELWDRLRLFVSVLPIDAPAIREVG